jgi:DNA mismatch repair protein MutS2
LELPEPVLVHARHVLPRLQADFQELLAELHKQVEDNTRRAKEMEEATRQLAGREAELQRDAQRREQQRQREWDKKSESILARFEAQAQTMLDQLTGKAAEQAQRLIAKTKREFREEAAPPVAAHEATLSLAEGAKVRLKDVREIATIRRLLKNGLIEVEAGFLKMQIPREDIVEVVPQNAAQAKLPKNVQLDTGPSWDVSYRELNVIGQRAEEAIAQVDKFLDSAALASIQRVRIIHGHGMGILKKAVSELLGTNPHVSRFYPATQAEGGAGATVVELRE